MRSTETRKPYIMLKEAWGRAQSGMKNMSASRKKYGKDQSLHMFLSLVFKMPTQSRPQKEKLATFMKALVGLLHI